jgi:RimJ/RimL family protein N-acetyltransferase
VTVTLRRANRNDEALLHAWRNDLATRASAFTEHEVSAEEHRVWFARKLRDPSCAILIAEKDGRPVAQVRFDRVEPEVAEVDISVDPEARGEGVGRLVLKLAVRDAERLLGVVRVRARVKPDNEASLTAFRAAGFRVIGEAGDAVELLHALNNDPSAS